MKRFAVLTSGGDAPGMNAAIRAAVLLGIGRGCEVLGVRRGFQGLLEGDLEPLEPGQVVGVLREGGTFLGSARCLDFHRPDARAEARRQLSARGVEGIVVIGGNGSLTGLAALTDPAENDTGLRGLGIPASIDNDVGVTRLAIGVDTAVNTIVDACDKISDTASAHDRTFIVEVMGRECGYLAMTSAIASGANAVLFPEMNKTEDEIVETVARAVRLAQSRRGRSKRVLVIKAEGVGVSVERLKALLGERLRSELGDVPAATEVRVTVLGHVVRGGRPSALDRQVASRLANVAVQALLSGKSRRMAAWLPAVGLPEALVEVSASDPQCSVVDLDHVLAETRAMLDGTSRAVQWRREAFRQIEDVLAL